jgi:phosphoribosyl 1,2-cyclic phosphodiesterase
MIIRCWGTRGSIPVCGREYLTYGGSTTCMEVQTDDDQVIILDAGTGIRKLGHTLLREKRRDLNIIFTHAHWDHLLGFPFFGPLYVAGTRITAFGCPFAQNSIRAFLSPTMAAPNFPVDLTAVKATIEYRGACAGEFQIGSVTVTPILLSHPNQGIGYKLTEDGKTFVFLTDNELTFVHPGGLTYEDYRRFSAGADLLLHDAEYTQAEYEYKKTWGHSVYTDALRLAMEAEVARFGLLHHNQERTDEGVEAIVTDCQRILAEKGSSLDCFAAHEGMEIEL